MSGAAAVPAPLAGLPVGQIGIVTRDLERGVRQWSALFGIGPWSVYEYGPETVPTLTFRGEPGRYAMRLALTTVRPQVEIIEPLQGPSIYDEWLDEHGEGLQHIAVFVESVAKFVPEMERAGYELVQSGAGYGLHGDGCFAYFDTVADLGIITELIEVPKERRRPVAVLE